MMHACASSWLCLSCTRSADTPSWPHTCYCTRPRPPPPASQPKTRRVPTQTKEVAKLQLDDVRHSSLADAFQQTLGFASHELRNPLVSYRRRASPSLLMLRSCLTRRPSLQFVAMSAIEALVSSPDISQKAVTDAKVRSYRVGGELPTGLHATNCNLTQQTQHATPQVIGQQLMQMASVLDDVGTIHLSQAQQWRSRSHTPGAVSAAAAAAEQGVSNDPMSPKQRQVLLHRLIEDTAKP